MTELGELPEPSEVDFHHTREAFLRQRDGGGRLWISSGAAIAVAVLAVVIVIVSIVWVAPAAHRANEARTQAAALAAAQSQSRTNGLKLLHRFDCTYGRAIIANLTAQEQARRSDAETALRAYDLLRQSNRMRLAAIQLTQRHAALRAVKQYHALRLSLKPLDGDGPCP